MANPLGLALRNRRAGHDALAWARPELDAPQNFVLTSPAFEHGAPIPALHRGKVFSIDLSPSLRWTTPPVKSVELVLVVEDPDAPSATAPTHLLTVGIDPALGGFADGDLAKTSPIVGLRHGRAALGHRGWAGPAPIPSHGPHSYVFQLFAVDRALELPPRFGRDDAIRAMSGHVIGRARLDGTYEIP